MVPFSVPEPVDSNSVAPDEAVAPPPPPPPVDSLVSALLEPLLLLFLAALLEGGMSLVLSSLPPQPSVKIPRMGIRNIAAPNPKRFMIQSPFLAFATRSKSQPCSYFEF